MPRVYVFWLLKLYFESSHLSLLDDHDFEKRLLLFIYLEV